MTGIPVKLTPTALVDYFNQLDADGRVYSFTVSRNSSTAIRLHLEIDGKADLLEVHLRNTLGKESEWVAYHRVFPVE